MNKPSTYIYSGLIIILLGLGGDSLQLIPSEYAFIIGAIGLIYGTLIYYKLDRQFFSLSKELKFDWKKLSSKVYIVVGIALARMYKFIDAVDQIFELKVFFSIVGLALAFYGLNLHFKEKKEKREGGNIEKENSH